MPSGGIDFMEAVTERSELSSNGESVVVAETSVAKTPWRTESAGMYDVVVVVHNQNSWHRKCHALETL